MKIFLITLILALIEVFGQPTTIEIKWWFIGGWQGGGCAYVVNEVDDPIIYLRRGEQYTFNINTLGHPIIIEGLIDTIDSGTISVVITDKTPELLNYHCLYSCNHPNGHDHNCWMIDYFHDFEAGNLVVILDAATIVTDDSHLIGYSLYQNNPNPFNSTTRISYSIPIHGHVDLRIYDLLGNGRAVLEDGYKSAGNYALTFNASDLASGIYFYRLQVYTPGRTGGYVETKKMILLK